MTDRKRRGEPNAGAFMGPDVMIPTPMGRLGELPPPRESANDDELPPPRTSLVERFVDRVRRLAGR
ncbi:MAG TPA: hypothetical protein VGC90_03470 [Candidatus Limnocylindrales bacterium]|jgi:hypothetical protein